MGSSTKALKKFLAEHDGMILGIIAASISILFPFFIGAPLLIVILASDLGRYSLIFCPFLFQVVLFIQTGFPLRSVVTVVNNYSQFYGGLTDGLKICSHLQLQM